MRAEKVKKKYFNLDDVAAQLKCKVGDLLHYGAIGELGLSVLMAGEKATLHFWDSNPIESDDAKDLTENDAFMHGERIIEELFGPFPLCLRYAKQLEAECLTTVTGVGDRGESVEEFSEWELLTPLNASEIKIVVDEKDFHKFKALYQSNHATGVQADWKTLAWDIGSEWMKKIEKETGKRPTVVKIAKYVEGELSKRNIPGGRGKYLDWETIKREALTGITGRERGENLRMRKGNPHLKRSPPSK